MSDIDATTGRTDPEGLAEVLLTLAGSRASGLLTVTSAAGTRGFYFYMGLCASLQSDAPEDALENAILRSGWLTPEGIAALVARTGKAKPTSGELLMVLRQDDLPQNRSPRDALQAQLVLAGAACFAVSELDYAFDPSPPNMPTSRGLELDAAALIIGGVASAASPQLVERLLAQLGSGMVAPTARYRDVQYLMAAFFGKAVVAQLGRPPWRVADRLAGPASTAAIRRAVAALHLVRAVEAAPEPPLTASASSADIPMVAAIADPVSGVATAIASADPDELNRLLDLDYLRLFGVDAQASADTVREASRNLLAQYDARAVASAPPDVRPLVAMMAARVREARATLLHPEGRRQYLASLAPAAPSPHRGRTPVTGVPLDEPSRGEVDALVAEAKRHETAGQWAEARAVLSRAIDARPKAADLHARMGWYTYKSANMSAGERERLYKYHLDYAVALSPNDPLAHYYWGTIWANQGNKPRARLEYNLALKGSPTFYAAREALEQLDRQPAARPAPASPSGLPAGLRRDKKKSSKLLLVLVPLGAIVLVAALVMRPTTDEVVLNDGNFEYSAKDLGTTLSLRMTAHEGDTFVVRVDDGWFSLSEAERTAQAETIARRVKADGFNTVRIFHGNKVVATTSGGVATLQK